MGADGNQKSKGEGRMIGEVTKIFFREKKGSIHAEDGQDYEFYESSLLNGLKFRDIYKQLDMEFEINQEKTGKRIAFNCRAIENRNVKYFKEIVLDLCEKKDQYDIFCDNVKTYAERLKSGDVTTSMIRKIYARVLNARKVTDIKLLRPHFAYTSGRNEKLSILREFMNLLDYLAKKMDINNEQHLQNFKQFMEAIVAYRKYVGNDK